MYFKYLYYSPIYYQYPMNRIHKNMYVKCESVVTKRVPPFKYYNLLKEDAQSGPTLRILAFINET